jgi:hypothetical protein
MNTTNMIINYPVHGHVPPPSSDAPTIALMFLMLIIGMMNQIMVDNRE